MPADWPRFSGKLLVDSTGTLPYHSDYGRICVAQPAVVLKPANVEDVVRAVHHARDTGIPLVSRGCGHTTRGQSIAEGALVLDMTALDRILAIEGDRARTQTGARWNTLLAETLASGLTPPVLTDYLDLTIGGTLAMGGIGGQSFRYGFQTDNVLELSVVTGTGDRVTCSADEASDLFDACRGGLGQFGIVVEATLRLVPAPGGVTVFHFRYPDVASFLRAQEQVIEDGRFDYVLGNVVPTPEGDQSRTSPWLFDLECVRYTRAGPEESEAQHLVTNLKFEGDPVIEKLDFAVHANRLDALVAIMKQAGTWQATHPWLDLFLPATRADEYLTRLLTIVDRQEMSGGLIIMYPLITRNAHVPSPGLPEGEHAVLLGVLPNIQADSPDLLARFEQKCAALFAEARDLGATIYPHSFPVGSQLMGEREWERQLSRTWDDIVALKDRYDPDRILNPGVGMFGRQE